MVYLKCMEKRQKNTKKIVKPEKSVNGSTTDSNSILSKKDLKHLISGCLRDVNIDPQLIEVEVSNGPKVTLKGELDTQSDKVVILQTVRDVLGIENITDQLTVYDRNGEIFGEDNEYDDDLLDEDNQSVGTEDVFRSVEDGVPYIPPMDSHLDDNNYRSQRTRKRYYRNF